MASPQKENGYTQIANQLLEALMRAPLRGSEFAMINAIMRKTYGFHKKSDSISIDQLVSMLKLSRRAVIYNLQDLEAKNIIFIKRAKTGEKNLVNVISINKDYDTWLVYESAPQVRKNRGSAKLRKRERGSAKPRQKVVQNLVKDLPSFAPTKETVTKKSTKETIATPSVAGEINQLIDCFKEVNPSYRLFYSNKTQRASLLRLCELHGAEQVRGVISILSETNKIPYVPQVTTPYQLEQKWASLANALIKKKQELQKINVFKV